MFIRYSFASVAFFASAIFLSRSSRPEATATTSPYAELWTETERPDWSPPTANAARLNSSSHSIAAAVEHAIDGPPARCGSGSDNSQHFYSST